MSKVNFCDKSLFIQWFRLQPLRLLAYTRLDRIHM